MTAATVSGAVGTAEPFNRKVVFWGIAASLLAAAGFFLLSTYTPEFRIGGRGGATVDSRSAVGYAGLVRLLKAAGETPEMATTDAQVNSDALLIVPLQTDMDMTMLDELLTARSGHPTLFILPKWQMMPMRNHPGWETEIGRLPAENVDYLLGKIILSKVGRVPAMSGPLIVEGRSITPPRDVQWIVDRDPWIAAGEGQGILSGVADEDWYVLADPDLMNNAGLKDVRRADAALALIRWMKPGDGPILFNLWRGTTGSPKHDIVKLMIEPPFLGMTLTLLVATILAFLHGLGRFGPPRGEVRALPFGKRALVDTTAMLFRRAGRLAGLGDRYAALMRVRAGILLNAPTGLQPDALDQWLDGCDRERADGFSMLAHALEQANTDHEMHHAASQLHDWLARRLCERQ